MHGLDGQAGRNAGIDHRSRVSHDPPALQMLEAVHKCTHGPLHTCGHHKRHESQCRSQHSAVAGVAPCSTFEAQGHKRAARRVGRSCHLGCHGIHLLSTSPNDRASQTISTTRILNGRLLLSTLRWCPEMQKQSIWKWGFVDESDERALMRTNLSGRRILYCRADLVL